MRHEIKKPNDKVNKNKNKSSKIKLKKKSKKLKKKYIYIYIKKNYIIKKKIESNSSLLDWS